MDVARITSYNVCYTKLLRQGMQSVERNVARIIAQGQEVGVLVAGDLGGDPADARAALPRDRVGDGAQRDREVHVGACLPGLRRPPAAAGGARGDGLG